MITLVDALRAAAAEASDQVAFTFLGDSAPHAITYEALDRHAQSLAARIQQRSSTGARIAVLLSPGVAYVVSVCGILYAGAVPVPLYRPTRKNARRLASIIADAEPAGVVMTDRSRTDDVLACDTSIWRLGPECDDSMHQWTPPPVTPDSLALLQYTSGSTARPKGVMLTHRHLFRNHLQVVDAFGLDASSRIVGWLPPFHDMGLIGHLFEPIYSRIPAALLSPSSFVAEPVRWLRAISTFGATISGGPNMAYDICIDRVRDSDTAGLNLETWTTAFNGSECVRRPTMVAFARKFARCGFSERAFAPCYGLAEATLLVSAHGGDTAGLDRPPINERVQSIGPREYVSCGRAGSATHIAIVEAESGRVCAPREIGEIWVAGGAVAAGYWKRSDESARTFRNALDGHSTPFLRTGDLGFVDDGQLYVTGRLRQLIIIGGANHHAEDIEMEVARSHPALERLSCAAFALDDGTAEGAVIVQEVPNETLRTTLREWRDAIAAAVMGHCKLPPRDVVFVSRRGIPRTSSGKLQRNECRRRYLEQELPVIDGNDDAHLTGAIEPVPDTVSVEREVASICRSALGLSVIDPHANLLALGIDSLLASRLLVQFEERFEVRITMRSLFRSPTITAVARTIEECRSSQSDMAPVSPTDSSH